MNKTPSLSWPGSKLYHVCLTPSPREILMSEPSQNSWRPSLKDHILTSVVAVPGHLFFPLLAIFFFFFLFFLRKSKLSHYFMPLTHPCPCLISMQSPGVGEWWVTTTNIPPVPAQRVVSSPDMERKQTLCFPIAFPVGCYSVALLATGPASSISSSFPQGFPGLCLANYRGKDLSPHGLNSMTVQNTKVLTPCGYPLYWIPLHQFIIVPSRWVG